MEDFAIAASTCMYGIMSEIPCDRFGELLLGIASKHHCQTKWRDKKVLLCSENRYEGCVWCSWKPKDSESLDGIDGGGVNALACTSDETRYVKVRLRSLPIFAGSMVKEHRAEGVGECDLFSHCGDGNVHVLTCGQSICLWHSLLARDDGQKTRSNEPDGRWTAHDLFSTLSNG